MVLKVKADINWLPLFSLTNEFFFISTALVLPETGWSYTNELNTLEEEFSQASTKARADEFKKMTKSLAVKY